MSAGTVYLICFKEKLHHAKHYIGFCEEGNLEARIERHRAGNGSKLMAAATQAGIAWEVARVWEDVDRNFERQLKNSKNGPRLCPFCNDKLKKKGGE